MSNLIVYDKHSKKNIWLARPLNKPLSTIVDGKPKTKERFLNGEIPLVEYLIQLTLNNNNNE